VKETQELKMKNQYALKSANETKFWLGLLRDSGKAQADVTDNILNEVAEISKILAKSILTLKGKIIGGLG